MSQIVHGAQLPQELYGLSAAAAAEVLLQRKVCRDGFGTGLGVTELPKLS